ncbi:adhesion G protein-coupled receptor F5 isoform X4 [Lates calcarifer]|uniref:Adhesion G protein-coupled receptor F5 isoform X4 n=1 Tax=Lates calcarifer TaxID=8187 RepID=A0AAJ8DQR0_LATCA|nr:adhesion G protein-coupled receptor F5 isoform X4 [Lates calcarifer]
MALPKAVGYMIVLLAIYYSLENQGYRQSLGAFFEELMGTKASPIHTREKRQAASNSSDYVLQVVINISDLDRLRDVLSQLPLPLPINSTVQITTIKATTVCQSNTTGYQCRCEENFAWSYNNCISHGACDTISGDTCGCINALPADGQFCQLNTSLPVTTPPTPSPTSPNDPVDIDLVVDLRIPASSMLSNLNLFRDTLRNFSFPLTITPTVVLVDLNFTTVCYPNSTGGLWCQCEAQFAWSCDKCNTYGACNNTTSHTCDCINGLPSDGGFCEPITNVTLCPTPSPEITTTTPMMTTTTPMMTTTTPAMTTTTMPPPPSDPVDIDLVVDLRIPASSVLSNLNLFRDTLRNFSFPLTITPTVVLVDLNFTTVCYPNSTGGLRCQCEAQFAWSCDKCNTYGACSNTTSHTCDCINGLPSDGGFCEPITNVTLCPTPSPEITTTTPMMTTTTPMMTTTTPAMTTTTMPPPPSDPVDIDLVVDLRIPASSVLSNLNLFRDTLRNFSFPLTITPTVVLVDLNFTTVCYPNSTGGLWCQCEAQFAWSCDKCNTYGACSNTTSHTCDCINGLPSDGGFCEPITNVTLCPTPSPEITTTTPMMTTTTPMMTTTTPMMTTTTPMMTTTTPAMTTTTMPPPPSEEDIDLVIDLRIPASSMLSNFNIFRDTLRNFSFPLTITPSLKLTGVNFTTGCSPNSTGGLRCECEEQFAWSCDKCNTYGACNNTTSHTCDCINGLPSDGGFCEPITSVTLCEPNPANITTPPPSTTATTPMPTTTTTPMPTTTTTPMPTNTTTPMTTNTTTPVTTTTPMPTTTTTPMPTNTTTPMTTTTPMPTTTTTPMPTITTTPMTTTTTTPMTTTPPPITTTVAPPTTAIEERRLSFTMERDFDPAYNQTSNEVYQDTNNAIQKQSKKYIKNLHSVTLSGFRRGSTIADYTVRAPAFQEGEIEALEIGVFEQMAEKYSMIYDSLVSLPFTQPFFGTSVTIPCGPAPSFLNFSGSFTAEWRHNDKLILKDSEYSFKQDKEKAYLTVSRFFSTNNGEYECRLKGKNTFRQKSNRVFTFKEPPVIRIEPVKKKVRCVVGKTVKLDCSVNSPYKVEFKDISAAGTGSTISYTYTIAVCGAEQKVMTFTCQGTNLTEVKGEITITLVSSTEAFDCDEEAFGVGKVGDEAEASCKPNEEGERIAVCQKNGKWDIVDDSCILKPIKELLNQSESLTPTSLPVFLGELSEVTVNLTKEVVESPNNINAIVAILSNVANTTSSLEISITKASMEDILITAGVLTIDGAKDSWDTLNTKDTERQTNSSVTRSSIPELESVSSSLLQSLEVVTSNLNNNSFEIVTPSILLNKTTFTDTFNADFNASVEIDIPEDDGITKAITVITFSSMDNVLPARDEANSSVNVINGRVILVQTSGTINNISFAFDVINDTLNNPQCVFWNFSLFDGLGGWDNEGCELITNVNETVTCNCNHLTSFSILMSPYALNIPALDYITYIGVGISMASLVICLIIEAVIWRKIRKNNTSYLRHVSIVNIAVSLLIANIWFIIGAAISDAEKKNQPACTAATFFIHFFYLALFFWMLASALLLLYRTVSVFDGGLSKNSMLAIGFSLGYGAPLLIAVITIAVTAPSEEYIRGTGVCWLNWYESKALLAFVIPALMIVLINLIILCVVIYKMLRRRAVGGAAQAAERHVLVVIARSLAVLTPFFGITWGLGVGTMTSPKNVGIHATFALFNSLQGFFILVFGTLLDKKVRSEITIKSQTSGTGTRSTSAGTSSSSGLGFFRNWRRGRDGYNMSSSESGASHSFTNT